MSRGDAVQVMKLMAGPRERGAGKPVGAAPSPYTCFVCGEKNSKRNEVKNGLCSGCESEFPTVKR